MYQISSDLYTDHPQLHDEVVECITSVISDHLNDYLTPKRPNIPYDQLHKYVAQHKLKTLIPLDFQKGLVALGIDPRLFMSKKIAQLKAILDSPIETPVDIFHHYLIHRMLLDRVATNMVRPAKITENKAMYQYLYALVLEYLGSENSVSMVGDNLMSRTDKYMDLITCFDRYTEQYEGYCIVFDRTEYTHLDTVGIEQTLYAMAHGDLAGNVYGLAYVEELFVSLGYPLPAVLATPKSSDQLCV